MRNFKLKLSIAFEKLNSIKDELIVDRPFLDVYLYKLKTKCGRPSCKCMSSKYRHELWCISYMEDGKSKTKTISITALAVIRQLAADYREIRTARSIIVKQSKALLSLIDSLTHSRLKEGKKIFKQLMRGK